MLVPARYYADVPPGFDGFPLLYLLSMFSIMMIVLLSLEWMWRLVWGIVERPTPIKHPSSAVRYTLIFILLGTILRTGPNLVWMSFWKDASPALRQWMLQVDSFLDSVSFIPFSIAWIIGYLGGPMIVYQLSRHPLPVHLWPTKEQITRPLKIGLSVFIIALAVVFAR